MNDVDTRIELIKGEISRLNNEIQLYNSEIEKYEDDFKIVSDQMEELANLIIICQSIDLASAHLATTLSIYEEHIHFLDSVPYSQDAFSLSDLKVEGSSYNNVVDLNLEYTEYLKKNVGSKLIAMEEEIGNEVGKLLSRIDSCEVEISQYQKVLDDAILEKIHAENNVP